MNDCLAIQDKKEETFLYRIFISHPELNASAVARRMGISQSLMSQYISGIKKPSQEREALIVNTIKDIGKVGCKHKPATLSGWLAFAFLSFIVTPLISVPLTWYICWMIDRATIKDKECFDPSDFTFKR